MKKLFLLFMILPFVVHAQNAMQTTREEAIAAAKGILQKATDHTNSSLTLYSVETVLANGHTVLYEVLFESGESVVVAGNKMSIPILSINFDSERRSVFVHPDEYPLGYLFMLDRIYREQCACFELENQLQENEEWNNLLNDNYITDKPSRYNSGEILLTTKWLQGKGNHYCNCDGYNRYLPISDGECTCGGDTARFPAGCTATAIAQVMNYWKYPVVTSIPQQIDWCNMPDSITCGTTPDEQIDAVALFMKILTEKIGVSYGSISAAIDWMGLYQTSCFGFLDPRDAIQPLQDIFGYSEDMEWRSRTWNMSTWSSIISNEIQNGRPVVYWAFEDAPWNGAHTFVCDGYNSVTGLFHFNWGHTINGIWCSIDNIVEGTGMHWTRNECAIIGIQPGGYQDFCYYNLSLDNFYQYFYLNHNPSIYPPYSVVPQTSTILTSASASSSASWRTIPYGAVAKYQAHVEINLEDGFEAEAGSEFEAEIVSCGKCDDWRGGSSTGEPSTNYSSVVHETKHVTDKTNFDFQELFPNPTDGELTMNVEGTVESIVVYNLQGQPVGGWHMLAVSDGSVTIDVRPLRSGTYLLCVRTTDGKVTTGRFVRK